MAADKLARTTAHMIAAGYFVDSELWQHEANCSGKCTQCYAGCHDSP